MATDTESLGRRLARLAHAELGELRAQLTLARDGRDRALHRARKTLQRLRAMVRLLEPIDPALSERENRRLRRLRMRLAPLRDADARRQTFRVLAARPRWRPHAVALRELAAIETPRHDAAWQSHPPEASLWSGVDRECALLAQRIETWPFVQVDGSVLETALRQAEKRMKDRIRAAAGEHTRDLRHELRRKLRRYANLQRAAAAARGDDDADAQMLLDLAKRCGHEGDLWMAVASARRELGQHPELRPVAKALESERRALCRYHDRLLKRRLF